MRYFTNFYLVELEENAGGALVVVVVVFFVARVPGLDVHFANLSRLGWVVVVAVVDVLTTAGGQARVSVS
jgi:hypothetical protein